MARRTPITRKELAQDADRTGADLLGMDDLDELLSQARVPKESRAACALHLEELFDWYVELLSDHRRTEARRAESLRQLAEAVRISLNALASLPRGERLQIEPNYSAYIKKAQAAYVLKAEARAAVAREMEKRDPQAQGLAELFACEAVEAVDAVKRQRREMSPLVLPLPLEHIFGALIESTEKRSSELEAQVSRESTKRRGTYARNQLAVNLKAIIMGCSPELANDERGAEDWAVLVLDTAGISNPDRDSSPKDFRAMFALNRTPPPDHLERLTEARRAFQKPTEER
jgi:hypothetical protein